MTSRVVVVPVTTHDPADDRPAELLDAMLEDVVDMAAAMPQAEAALAFVAAAVDRAEAVAWPGMARHAVASLAATDVLAAAGVGEGSAVVLVAPDVPDLPPLLVGKLFSALTSAEVAACPADGGGLVALGARLPVADWLRELAPSLDAADMLARLQQAAPVRALSVGPGWHRIRRVADTARLDEGLQGWDATRAWLSAAG
ncbi:MAG: DUF2064 domain-containing protein [Frankiales bacterium]|nr:DUF2064 domain-containing protein [Frankiales bacterium]